MQGCLRAQPQINNREGNGGLHITLYLLSASPLLHFQFLTPLINVYCTLHAFSSLFHLFIHNKAMLE